MLFVSKKLRVILIIFILIISIIIGAISAEEFNDFEIPSEKQDIVLCLYKSDLNSKNPRYYAVTADGTAKLIKADTQMNYMELTAAFKAESNSIKIKSLTEKQLSNLKKINTDKKITFGKNVVFESAPPAEIYYIVQKTKYGFTLLPIKYIEAGGVREEKCTSKYTNNICDYIDYAAEANNDYVALKYSYFDPLRINENGFYCEEFIFYKNGEVSYEMGYENDVDKKIGTTKIQPPDEATVEKILKIKNNLSKPETPNFIQQPAEKSYTILKNDGGEILLDKFGFTLQHNKSKYTVEICDYIDYAIGEVRKQVE